MGPRLIWPGARSRPVGERGALLFIEVDFEGIELRLAAELAKERGK